MDVALGLIQLATFSDYAEIRFPWFFKNVKGRRNLCQTYSISWSEIKLLKRCSICRKLGPRKIRLYYRERKRTVRILPILGASEAK